MKRNIFLLAIIIPSISYAQLKVDSLGKTTLFNSLNCKQIFSSVDGNSYIGELRGRQHGLKINTSLNASWLGLPTYFNNLYNSGDIPVGLQVNTDTYANSTIKDCFGIVSRTVNGFCYGNEITQSITGIGEGGSTSSQTFGVVGSYEGYSGAGVYGSYGIVLPVSDGRYAGYFNGDVKVTGTLHGTIISNSDIRLKQEVRDLNESGERILDKLEMLSPISYKYDAELLEPKPDNLSESTEEKKISKTWTNPIYEKTHYGLVAQELQQVYPDLVYENDNGYLSVNYTELIPILLQSIKELKAQVDKMGNPNARKAKDIKETTDLETAVSNVAGMEQNVPNPFSGKTDIAIYLPESTQTATLYIYDLSGKQIEQHVIEGRGDTIMTIHADRMDAGMYIYSLIADNKVVATRRMIVTK